MNINIVFIVINSAFEILDKYKSKLSDYRSSYTHDWHHHLEYPLLDRRATHLYIDGKFFGGNLGFSIL